mgnify:CR=1 FL=1
MLYLLIWALQKLGLCNVPLQQPIYHSYFFLQKKIHRQVTTTPLKMSAPMVKEDRLCSTPNFLPKNYQWSINLGSIPLNFLTRLYTPVNCEICLTSWFHFQTNFNFADYQIWDYSLRLPTNPVRAVNLSVLLVWWQYNQYSHCMN